MATNQYGYIEIANAAAPRFTNASDADLLIFTDSNTQSICLGVNQGSNAAMKLTSSNVQITRDLYVGTQASPGYISAGNLGMFRNRVINGDMRIDQRNNLAPIVLANATYPCDRFLINTTTAGGTGTAQSMALTSSDAPFSQGFKRALRVSVGATPYTLTAGSGFTLIKHKIEANNISDLNWSGNGNGSPVTVSFWFRAKVSGNYPFTLRNPRTSEQSYVTSFNVAVADAWAFYTITIPPPTGTGTQWNAADNLEGIDIHIGGVFKSNTTSTAGWSTPGTNPDALSTGMVDWMASANAYIDVTGLQLEKGAIATPFEFRSYGIELQLCQRYYEVIEGVRRISYNATTRTYDITSLPFKVQKRAIPSNVGVTLTSLTRTNIMSVYCENHTTTCTNFVVDIAGTGGYESALNMIAINAEI